MESIWLGRTASTASIDAAMTLVPERRSWAVNLNSVDQSADATVCLQGSDRWADKHGHAETPALALCAAALRARAADTPSVKP